MNESQGQGEYNFWTHLLRLPDLQNLALAIALAFLAGLLLDTLHVPAGWLLGPLVAGIFCAVFQGGSPTLPPILILTSRSVLGLVAASRFSLETLQAVATYALPLLLCIPLAASLSLVNGYLLARWAGLDRATSFLGCIPGASTGIIAMSEEVGADALAVALLQYIRMLLVIAIVPAIATFLFPHATLASTLAAPALAQPPSLPPWIDIPVLALCCPVGTRVGQWLRLPSSSFLGAFFVGIVLFWSVPRVVIPDWLFAAGLLVVGLSIGLNFDWHTTRKLFKAALIDIGLVLGLIFGCLGIAYGFHWVAQIDLITAILGLTPGGLEAMLATVIQLGGDTGVVLALQMTRMFLILFLSPWLISLWFQPKPRNH
ncbi:MAG: AbrB family transcriptional regulator [Cyanobacteriota bacterium]|nr:AbrB family transcriptional regulator [Cyanobacteriota bacterium]